MVGKHNTLNEIPWTGFHVSFSFSPILRKPIYCFIAFFLQTLRLTSILNSAVFLCKGSSRAHLGFCLETKTTLCCRLLFSTDINCVIEWINILIIKYTEVGFMFVSFSSSSSFGRSLLSLSCSSFSSSSFGRSFLSLLFFLLLLFFFWEEFALSLLPSPPLLILGGVCYLSFPLSLSLIPDTSVSNSLI